MEQIRNFDTGAVRGSSGKLDFVEYMSTLALGAYGEHMRKSAEKYGAGNWLKGIPADEYMKSLRRHLWIIDIKEQTGIQLEPETDHLASCMFNIMGAMHERELLKLQEQDTAYGYPVDRQQQIRVL